MFIAIRRALLVLLALAVLLPPAAVHAQRVPAPAYQGPQDLQIPNGYFFTQAAPGQNGAGYRVANEAGIPFWDEFRRHGGLPALGYPVSRRFIWRDTVVQMFQFGALQWHGAEIGAEVRSPGEVGNPPAHARRAEPMPRSANDVERYPWSGWWWPASFQAGGPRLFDPGGPLQKYDYFATSLGLPHPGTMEWERAEIFFAGIQWAGHCNGWAAASLLEPEPKEDRVINGVHFSVADQKGLLTAYHFADAALWSVGGEGQELSPADFHRTLLSWIGQQRKGAVFTFRVAGEEVWSYPAFKYESIWGPDPGLADVWHVRTVVWLMHNEVPASFVGGHPWPGPEGKLFEYTLYGDPHNPSDGIWSPRNSGPFGRPYMVWYPDPERRNVDRQLASPGLDYALIQRIVGGV